MELLRIYKGLKGEFGKQGWWPCITSNKRFEIIVGAILTQNTSWKNVEKAIKNLDKFNFLRKEAIRQLKEEELGQLIKSSGFYKQKAKKLKKVIEFLDSGEDVKRENLLKVWGIGEETADCILLYAYEKPVFIIDGYTRRVMKRIGYEFKGYEGLQKIFMDNLEKNVELFKEFHALLVKLGKEYCKKKARCEDCVLRRKKLCGYDYDLF